MRGEFPPNPPSGRGACPPRPPCPIGPPLGRSPPSVRGAPAPTRLAPPAYALSHATRRGADGHYFCLIYGGLSPPRTPSHPLPNPLLSFFFYPLHRHFFYFRSLIVMVSMVFENVQSTGCFLTAPSSGGVGRVERVSTPQLPPPSLSTGSCPLGRRGGPSGD